MANISKLDTSKGKITVNFPFINDDGSDSKYIISANQIGWAGGKLNDTEFDTTAELLTAIENEINNIVTEVSSAVPTLTVTGIDHTLTWNKAVEVAKINNQSITVKLPANPNTDTDTKVTSVDNHYTTADFSALTTESLCKIKTDKAGHIIAATSVNLSNYASKSEYNQLEAEFNELKELIGWNV